MAKHKFRKPVAAPKVVQHGIGPAGNMGASQGGSGPGSIPPDPSQGQPSPPFNTPMSNAARMSGRYGAPPPADEGA